MATLIKTFSDGRRLEFDRGRFDPWCVYLVEPAGTRRPPLDIEYFTTMRDLARRHGSPKVYADYVVVYERTSGEIDEAVLKAVGELAEAYGADALGFDFTMTTIYAGMIAEERKAFTKLGKRVKRLGIHQVVIEGFEPAVAANFSKGKRWREIDSLCSARGF